MHQYFKEVLGISVGMVKTIGVGSHNIKVYQIFGNNGIIWSRFG